MLFDDLPVWTISILAWINISYSKWRKFVVNLLTQLCNRRTTTKGVPWEGKSGSGNGLVLSIQGCSVDPSAWKCLTKTEAWVIHWTDSSELIPGSSLLWRLYTFLSGFYIPSYTAPHFILMPVLAKPVNNSNLAMLCIIPHFLWFSTLSQISQIILLQNSHFFYSDWLPSFHVEEPLMTGIKTDLLEIYLSFRTFKRLQSLLFNEKSFAFAHPIHTEGAVNILCNSGATNAIRTA